MSHAFLFADESGDFDFSRHPRASKFFILTTITMSSCAVGDAMNDLRRELVWNQTTLGDYFHCSEDNQNVRDSIFKLLAGYDFKVQATILEKSKAQPQVCKDKARFYKYGWYYHFKHGLKKPLYGVKTAVVTAASIGTKKEKLSFISNIDDVLCQTLSIDYRIDFRSCGSDACLQVADYCCWALYRKWERGDSRSYDLIKDRITYEYELWRKGTTHYY